MLKAIKDTSTFLKKKIKTSPKIAIILGTGLGNLADEINIQKTVKYNDIPNFPTSTVEGHKGQLSEGELSGKSILVMQGRFHFYEGYTMEQITFPIRVLKELGIKYLFVSNASGGLNPNFKVGDLMVISDHINLFGTNPLIGKNIDTLGPRFPDMNEAYNKKLISQAFEIARKNNIELQKGVYAGLTGPTFETPAEYKYLQIIGADAVGMSTVPEIIAARHSSITCFGISVITNNGTSDNTNEVSHQEVQEAANKAEPKMTLIFKNLIAELKL